uniref:Uncharacterized protein n=1 Tax=Rhizophora mucronata TaxID=61149 RepID=A0A2P2NN77_RHIMU
MQCLSYNNHMKFELGNHYWRRRAVTA